MTKRGLLGLCTMLLTLTTSGCAKELLAGGQGEVETVMTDDASSSRSRGPVDAPRFSLAGAGANAAQGRVDATASVVLIADNGREVPVAQGSGAVQIASGERRTLGRASVEARTYTRARVTFSRVTADVTGGLLIGGTSLVGLVTVQISEPVVVEVPVQLSVTANSRSRLVIDLNADAWLATSNPLTRIVTATAFRSAVAVRTE